MNNQNCSRVLICLVSTPFIDINSELQTKFEGFYLSVAVAFFCYCTLLYAPIISLPKLNKLNTQSFFYTHTTPQVVGFFLLVSQRVCIHVLVCVSLLLSLGKDPERLRLKYALFFAKYSLFVSFVEALNQPLSSSECGAPPWHCTSSARALCVRSAHVQKPPFKTDFLCRAFL